MADRLFAEVYDDSYSSPVLLDALPNIGDLGISWEVPFGVREIRLTAKMSPLAAYEKYRRYALQRLALHDHYIDRPVATADITYLGYGWGHLILRAKGPAWRLYDGLENTAATSGDNTDDIVKRALTDHASIVNSDQTNIAATTAAVTQTLPSSQTTTATTAGKLEDSGANFQTNLIQIGYIALNNTDSTWTTVTAIDSETVLSVAEDIFTIGENYTLWRPIARGTTTATLASTLIDSNADFLRVYADSNCAAFNATDKTPIGIAATITKTTLALDADIFTVDEQYIIGQRILLWHPPYEGSPVADVISEMVGYGNGSGAPVYFWLEDGGFQGGHLPEKPRPHLVAYSSTAEADWQVWRRDMRRAEIGRDFGNLATSVTTLFGNASESTTQTHNTGDYWTRDIVISGRNAIAGLADERASVYVNQQSDAILRRPWVIGCGRIMDGAGFCWPLWRMIAQGGGYLRVNDAFPEAALATAGYDRERQGRIVTLDYSYRRNQMRVVLDDDTRADRRFRELGFDESINRRLRATMTPYR